jgi:hypothetical protein
LRLTLLAPDIVERILDGRPTAGLARLWEPFPAEWEKQREQFLPREPASQWVRPAPQAPASRFCWKLVALNTAVGGTQEVIQPMQRA